MRSERVAVGLLVVSVCEWVSGRSFSEEGKGGIRERQSREGGRRCEKSVFEIDR